MAHTHGDPHTVVERDSAYNAGMFMGVALVLLLAVIGLALLFTQPWDDNGSSGPGIEDNVPGAGGGDNTIPGQDGTGGNGGSDNGGSGGEVQPPSGQ
jgi:hypothetical protein